MLDKESINTGYENKINQIQCWKYSWISKIIISDCNGTQTHNHLVCKRTLNHSTIECFVQGVPWHSGNIPSNISIITRDKLHYNLNFKDKKIDWYFLQFFALLWKGSQWHGIQLWKFESLSWFMNHDPLS